MTVYLEQRIYTIENKVNDQTARIRVTIEGDGSLTIDTYDKHRQFAFTKSNPDLIAAIGQCFRDASLLAAKVEAEMQKESD